VHVIVSFLDEHRHRRRAAFRGTLDRGTVYYVLYVAPERHYFALDLPVFEEVTPTLRLRTTAPSGDTAP